MPGSSSSYVTAFTINPESSRWLAAWWLGLHALLASSALAVGPGVGTRCVLLGLLLWHGAVRWPARAPPLRYRGDGRFSVPGHGPHTFVLTRAACYTAHWALLVLRSDRGVSCRILLLRDQVDPEAWRLLALVLRDPSGFADFPKA